MPNIGLIGGQDRDWAKQFVQQHGRAPGEQEWWDHRFARQIAGWTDADWDGTSALRSLLYTVGVTIKSGDAHWTLDEVAIVDQVIHNIAHAFGGDAARIISGVTIRRTHASRWPLGFAWVRCGAWEGSGIVRINDSAFARGQADHVLTHELGHYFQESRDLIDGFREATGGQQFDLFGIAQFNLTPYRCGGQPPNDWTRQNGLYEDFAASFETFVYHQIGDPIPGNVLDERRRQFFLGFGPQPPAVAPR
jgi:hypothetical protein